MNESTLSSCQSFPDDTIQDPSYEPENAAGAGEITVTSFLKKRKIETSSGVSLIDAGAVFAASNCGSESLAQAITSYNKVMYKAGVYPILDVVTRNKIEYAIMADGKKRVQSLSTVKLTGEISKHCFQDFGFVSLLPPGL